MKQNLFRSRIQHDEAITSRQVGEMLRAVSCRQPVLSENDFLQRRRLKLYRSVLKLTALGLLAVYSCAVLKEFFF